VVYCSMIKRDWTITFNDGSTATYFNISCLGAVHAAVNDWCPAKHPVTLAETKLDVFSLSLD